MGRRDKERKERGLREIEHGQDKINSVCPFDLLFGWIVVFSCRRREGTSLEIVFCIPIPPTYLATSRAGCGTAEMLPTLLYLTLPVPVPVPYLPFSCTHDIAGG